MPHRNSNSWHSSPPLISPPLLIILLPILILTLLFLTVPPLLSAVKTNNWNMNSLNILLVVFAILFGIFSRKNDDDSSSSKQQIQNDAFRSVSVSDSQQWYGFSTDERKVFDESSNRLQSPVTGVNRLRRSSSSYPDLRQIETGDDGYKFRFFDDFEIEKQFRSPARATFSVSDHRKRLPEYRSRQEELQEVHVKEIPVDTFEIRSSSPVKSRSPPSPPPPPPVLSRRHSNHMHRSVESRSEITEVEDLEFTRLESRPHDPPPPLSPSPPRLSAKTRSEKTERRKSNVKREIAMVWASVLSNQRKRKKKQRPKNDHNHRYDNVEELTNNTMAAPMTPPPPPPPPPSVFHSIFRKGLGKNKKIYSVPAPPPPPSRRSSRLKNQIPPPPQTPPPALPRRRNNTKPPLPNKSSNFNETLNSGNQSPLIPVPPPLPPFKLPAMKFVVRGDFVKIQSNQSSRSTSPEREHIDVEVSEATAVTNTVMNHNGNVGESVFCPSPDVNAKAATFIARLRGEWKLQKLNSIKEKGNASLPLARD
ncbi:unnamed protein product [Trifolium pratense]|uniref:Uncharacterized protein n=1 Tax=Trifolium pratense TaxID=57577 RepID=A0ACB0IZP2_TRIPR|nr:unnamed protein product [Trifolium pratense]